MRQRHAYSHGRAALDFWRLRFQARQTMRRAFEISISFQAYSSMLGEAGRLARLLGRTYDGWRRHVGRQRARGLARAKQNMAHT